MKRLCQTLGGILTPKAQLWLAWSQLAITLVGWPLSIVATWLGWMNEPPIVLSLSWWAILITALGFISASQANVKVSEEE